MIQLEKIVWEQKRFDLYLLPSDTIPGMMKSNKKDAALQMKLGLSYAVISISKLSDLICLSMSTTEATAFPIHFPHSV